MNDVVHISYQQYYTFHIKFEDGVEGDIDFSGFWIKVRFLNRPLLKEELYRGQMARI